MNLKDWKKFSDEVDENNDKESEEVSKENERLCKEWEERKIKRKEFEKALLGDDYVSWPDFSLPPMVLGNYISKTQLNFLEWQVGKLKLKI